MSYRFCSGSLDLYFFSVNFFNSSCSLILPFSKIGNPSKTIPSSFILFEKAGIDPGVIPPISEWWALFAK